MSGEKETGGPPLPEGFREAVAAFRRERPSPGLEARLREALRAAEARGVAPGEERARREVGARWKARGARLRRSGGWGVALAGLLVLVVAGREGELGSEVARMVEALPTREIAVRLPEEGWVEVPWSLGAHPEGTATVHVELPAEVKLHPGHAGRLASPTLTSCEGERCRHRFEADVGARVGPLRVRLPEPGRYELRVSHASKGRHIDEHFVVVAER